MSTRDSCVDCDCIIHVDNEFEAYEEDGTDAHWDDSRKRWQCQSCKKCNKAVSVI